MDMDNMQALATAVLQQAWHDIEGESKHNNKDPGKEFLNWLKGDGEFWTLFFPRLTPEAIARYANQ